jgi:hypothetical protein
MKLYLHHIFIIFPSRYLLKFFGSYSELLLPEAPILLLTAIMG